MASSIHNSKQEPDEAHTFSERAELHLIQNLLVACNEPKGIAGFVVVAADDLVVIIDSLREGPFQVARIGHVEGSESPVLI